jgi:NADH-quinone oxidoreductase subunit A
MSNLLRFLAFLLVDVALVTLIVVVTHLLGERHRQTGTGIPYESGMLPTGSARLRFPIDFYLIAMIFVIFDVAAVFLFAWAVSVRELGWPGYAAIIVFITETAVGLAYIWSMGAFDWGARRLREHRERHGVSGARNR